MSQNFIQPINAEDLPPEEFRFVKGQQAIYELCKAVEQDENLKAKLANSRNPETFLKIAAEQGYEFTVSDLQVAISWALEKINHNSDELDDYELSEEELEMVAGGTASVRAASLNSYWHETGILVNQQCFHLLGQSTEGRDNIEAALQTMELWVYEGNGIVELTDLDGEYSSYQLDNMSYDGLALSLLQDTSNKQTYSSGHITNFIL